ncbi:hypothetical protein D9M71_565250 [compost metagenome]
MLGRGFLVVVDVQLGDGQFALVGSGDVVQNRSDHFARAAPFSPVVDQHRAFSLQDFGFEGGVGDVFDKIAAHGSLQGRKQKNVAHHSRTGDLQEVTDD